MALPWFRMYAEFATDPLVRMLAFEDQRHFVMALCLKCDGTLDKQYPTPDIRRDVLTQRFGLSGESADGLNSLDAANSRIRKLGLVDADWQPRNWEKRQFQSDSSAERVKKWRMKRNGNVTSPLLQRNSNALDTDTDTDSEKEKKKIKQALRAATRVPKDFTPDASYAQAQCPDMDVIREAEKFRDHEFRKPRKDWDAAFRNWVRTCKDSGKYAKRSNLPPGFEDVEWT